MHSPTCSDDKWLLGVCCYLDLLVCANMVVAADARVPVPIHIGPPAAGQLLALLPDALWAGDLGDSGVA